MNLLNQYEKETVELINLNKIRSSQALSFFQEELAEFMRFFTVGTSFTLDVAKQFADKFFDKWLVNRMAQEIQLAKEEVSLHIKLVPLYEQLSQGTNEQWEEFVRLRFRLLMPNETELKQMVEAFQNMVPAIRNGAETRT